LINPVQVQVDVGRGGRCEGLSLSGRTEITLRDFALGDGICTSSAQVLKGKVSKFQGFRVSRKRILETLSAFNFETLQL